MFWKNEIDVFECITQLARNKLIKLNRFSTKKIKQSSKIWSTEDSWLGADVENLKQLDNILNHYLQWLTQAVEQIINLKNQEEAITTVERQLAAAHRKRMKS